MNEAYQINEGLLEYKLNEVDYNEHKTISAMYPSRPSEKVTTLPKAFASPLRKRGTLSCHCLHNTI